MQNFITTNRRTSLRSCLNDLIEQAGDRQIQQFQIIVDDKAYVGVALLENLYTISVGGQLEKKDFYDANVSYSVR